MIRTIRRTGWHLAIILCAVAADPAPSSAFGSGSPSGPPVSYVMASEGPRDGAVEAVISLDRVLFALNTVGTGLRVVPVEVGNDSDERVPLSRSADRITAMVENRPVKGTFTLSEADPEYWEGLSQDVRRWVTYPVEIGRGRSQTLYAFFDATEIQEMPDRFILGIASFDEDLELAEEAVMMAR